MKYAFINAHRRVWPVSVRCEQLEVSASGYLQHSLRKADQRPDKTVRRNISNHALLAHMFSMQVVGCATGPRMSKALVLDALRMAWFRRRPQTGMIVHSDRGSQYCSQEFEAALRAHG